jgi:hypothetical protein
LFEISREGSDWDTIRTCSLPQKRVTKWAKTACRAEQLRKAGLEGIPRTEQIITAGIVVQSIKVVQNAVFWQFLDEKGG